MENVMRDDGLFRRFGRNESPLYFLARTATLKDGRYGYWSRLEQLSWPCTCSIRNPQAAGQQGERWRATSPFSPIPVVRISPVTRQRDSCSFGGASLRQQRKTLSARNVSSMPVPKRWLRGQVPRSRPSRRRLFGDIRHWEWEVAGEEGRRAFGVTALERSGEA